MELFMKVIFRQGNLMELAFLITIMATNMKVLLKMVYMMEMGILHGQMEYLLLVPIHKETETQESL